MTTVEDLDVFKLAHQLALKTYAMRKKFLKEETFSSGSDATSRYVGGYEPDGGSDETW